MYVHGKPQRKEYVGHIDNMLTNLTTTTAMIKFVDERHLAPADRLMAMGFFYLLRKEEAG